MALLRTSSLVKRRLERRSDPGISYTEGNWQGRYWALLRVGWWWWIWFAWSQSQSKGPEKSASTATRILQPKSCLCIEQFAVFCCRGFVCQHFQDETGRLESICGFLKHQLLVHYIYKLHYKLQEVNKDASCAADREKKRDAHSRTTISYPVVAGLYVSSDIQRQNTCMLYINHTARSFSWYTNYRSSFDLLFYFRIFW